MKIYNLLIPPHVEAVIRHFHPVIKSKIRRALEAISIDPFIGKALKDQLSGLYSFRVSQYRIIYRIVEQEILIQVIDIDKRRFIYQKTLGLMSKIQ